ncbi:MAG: transcriptional regulator PtsJ [Xenophilus sp.]
MQIAGKTASEIFDSIRSLTQSGQLQPGQALPPVRDLAATLDVNRNTVASAYKRLVTSGIALSLGRLGTLVRQHAGPGEQEGTTPDSRLTDVADGNPNPAWLPDLSATFARSDYRPRLYGEPTVDARLAAYARQWCGIDCPSPFDVELAGGAVDAIERLLAAHLVAGDRVAVEDPCFLSSINTLRLNGMQAVGIPVDEQGMQAEGLNDALAAGAQAVILTPRAHNPTGCNLSAERAEAIRNVLHRHPHVLTIVDDHFALLCKAAYHSPIAASTHRWALVRSVSKVLGPDLRFAFVACDPQTASLLRLRMASGTTWVSHVLQDIVRLCLTDASWTPLIAKAREDYAHRRRQLVSALARHGIGSLASADGLNLWVPLDQDEQAAVFALAKRGWLVRAGSAFRVQESGRGLRITIAQLDDEQALRLAADIRHSIKP